MNLSKNDTEQSTVKKILVFEKEYCIYSKQITFAHIFSFEIIVFLWSY